MKLTFSKLQRLLNRKSFRDLYREEERFSGNRLAIFYSVDRSSCSKLGITIAKKWGKAHDRNRFKRVVREAFRTLYPHLPRGLILNVHPKEGYRELTPEMIQTELKQLVASSNETQSEPTKSGSCH